MLTVPTTKQSLDWWKATPSVTNIEDNSAHHVNEDVPLDINPFHFSISGLIKNEGSAPLCIAIRNAHHGLQV